MRLVTWNVNSLRARLPRVLQLLEEVAPDVVALQETKSNPQDFPVAELQAAGYGCVHHSGGRWAGVALLTRDGVACGEAVHGLPGEAVADEARWVEADVGGRRIASVYVPNGRALDHPAFAEKLTFLDAMRDRLPALDVVVGDFNVCPDDRDVYDPAAFVGGTHVTEDERSRLRAMLGLGYVDAFRSLHPDEVQYTWWDYRAGHFHQGLGLRIDLALVRDGVAVRDYAMLRDFRKGTKPSDHAPVLVELG